MKMTLKVMLLTIVIISLYGKSESLKAKSIEQCTACMSSPVSCLLDCQPVIQSLVDRSGNYLGKLPVSGDAINLVRCLNNLYNECGSSHQGGSCVKASAKCGMDGISFAFQPIKTCFNVIDGVYTVATWMFS